VTNPTDLQTLNRLTASIENLRDGSHSAHSVVTQIRPTKGLFDLELEGLWPYRELLGVLVKRDIQILYRQAALGIAWAILQPAFTVLIFAIIFGHFAKMPSDGIPYPIFAFAGVLPWTYFAEALRRSSNGLVTEAELVRKVYFPRLLVPIAGIIGPALDFFVGLVILLGLMLIYGISPTWNLLAVVPLLALAGLQALAVGLWLGPINVRFRDIKYTLPFLIQIWMYASPIVYPLSLIPKDWHWLYSLNPMVGVIEGFRWAIAGGTFNAQPLLISVAVGSVLIVGGLVFFKHMERTFADVI